MLAFFKKLYLCFLQIICLSEKEDSKIVHGVHIYSMFKTSYVFLQKPLVPASLDEVTVGTYWLKIGKSEDQVVGEIDKIKTK